MNIFRSLPKLWRSDDFEAEIPKLERSLSEARADLERLCEKREDVIFGGDTDELARLAGAIRESEDQIELIEIAMKGAERRRGEAAERERQQELERHSEALRKRVPELVEAYRQYVDGATKVAAALDLITEIKSELQLGHQTFESARRRDLHVRDPLVTFGAGRPLIMPGKNATHIPEFVPGSPDRPIICNFIDAWDAGTIRGDASEGVADGSANDASTHSGG